MKGFENLLSPFTVKGTTFKNRIFTAPNVLIPEDFTDFDTMNFLNYVEAKAAGGQACVTLGDVPPDLCEIVKLSDSELEADEGYGMLCALAERISRHGAVPSMELISAGQFMPFGMFATYGFLMGPCAGVDEDGNEIVEMDEALRKRVAGDYARICEILKRAGYKMIMIQAGHFWLFNQWLSPIWNKRTDEYGGDMRGRARFPMEVLDAIRDSVGHDLLIEYRISGDDLFEGGNTVEDIVGLVEILRDRIDIVHVSSGSVQVPGKLQTGITLYGPYGNNLEYASAIKKAHPDKAVSCVGNLINPEHMEECIAAGMTDFVCMARGAIVDPDFTKKLLEGRREDIIPCQRCFNCMNDRRAETGRAYSFECAMNPYTYKSLDSSPAQGKKRILVAGGGVAGINAAHELAARGHKVTLAEKEAEVGGIIRFSEGDTVKKDLKLYLQYLRRLLDKSGVKILMETEVTPELVADLKPDIVIAATGSIPLVPNIKGIEKAVHVLDVYDHPENLKPGNTVVVGGGLAGCESAVHIANLGQKVTVVEMRDECGADAFFQAAGGLKAAMAERQIIEMPSHTCREIRDDGVVLLNADGATLFVEADNVVFALGMRPENSLAEKLSQAGVQVISIGDCKKPAKMMDAIYDAVYTAISLG